MHGCTYSIIPDQIEAGSYMVAATITGGNVLIKNVIPKHLEPITSKLEKAGATIEEFDDSLRVYRTGDLEPLNIKTMPHPGFPTDMQPLMTVLLTLAKGTSIITEGIWENRFRYVDELTRMGANIQVDGRVAVIEGVQELLPAPMRAADRGCGAGGGRRFRSGRDLPHRTRLRGYRGKAAGAWRGHQAGGKARGRAAAGCAVSLQKAERKECFGSFRF